MPSYVIKGDGELLDLNGSPIRKYGSDDDKCYAVVVKCGHCGEGYFIPIMMTAKCKDIESAIEYVKATPRLQRSRKDVVLAAFEITPLERFFIESINDHDSYLRGYFSKDDFEIVNARIFHGRKFSYKGKDKDRDGFDEIKTADMFDNFHVLQRAFAPRYFGEKLVYPTRVNRDELLHEYFKQATIRFGIKRGDAFFPSLYYQMYGNGNDLGIKYVNSGYLTYRNDGKIVTAEITEKLFSAIKEKLDDANISSSKTKAKLEVDEQQSEIKRVSQVDKFNKRFEKYMKLKNEDGLAESQPGE